MHVCELQTLGVSADAYNCLLPSVLMKKLPQELCLSLSRRITEADWNLDNLMKQFSEELRKINVVVYNKINDDQRHKSVPGVPPASTALHTQSNNNCCYCEKQHASEYCTKVVDIKARKHIFRESNTKGSC